MANYHFARAGNWEYLVAEHDRWPAGCNTQRHWAHEGRNGNRSLSEVLGSLKLLRHHPEDLERAFFSSRPGSSGGWMSSVTPASSTGGDYGE